MAQISLRYCEGTVDRAPSARGRPSESGYDLEIYPYGAEPAYAGRSVLLWRAASARPALHASPCAIALLATVDGVLDSSTHEDVRASAGRFCPRTREHAA